MLQIFVCRIEKQKLVKFPEDPETQTPTGTSAANDEAQRILLEIQKINEKLGYVKKQAEQRKIHPILDSSQYLYPKPLYNPFHAASHQFSGTKGETLLLPSIRAVKFDKQIQASYNVPPRKSSRQQQNESHSEELYYRPNRVEVPIPAQPEDFKQLPTHFAIPVHLYKMNKNEYLMRNAPLEYKVKGYKIVGDVNNFYGKAKSKTKTKGKTNSKYHLFFLPREVALNEDSTFRNSQQPYSAEKMDKTSNESSRDEKLRERPHKNTETHLLGGRKKPSVKPHAAKTTVIPSLVDIVTAQQQPAATTTAGQSVLEAVTGSMRPPFFFNNSLVNATSEQTNAIKNAFQNLFKNPFKQETETTKPTESSKPTTAQVVNKPSSLLDSILHKPTKSSIPSKVQEFNTQADYKWEDENSNSAAENDDDEDYNSAALDEKEKKIFGPNKKHQYMQQIQQHQENKPQHHFSSLFELPQPQVNKEALKQGGIIIQRLKVRRGGIAIAGPGGVATAGSGGTAIVGPGGYALTHPRSLTIAGPGAKVIAIPSEVDLKDALQRTNLKNNSFPEEGKVVATGPTVYYSPPNSEDAEK